MDTSSSPTTAQLSGPITAAERIATLDIVRGFALLGILIMNMPGFSTSYYAEADGSHLWTDPVNKYAELARDMLFSGKFNSMFSLLFGLGFTIQLGRLTARDPAHATQLYCQRLLVLAGFALVHVLIFWTGDVLHIYAVLGVGLLLLRNASNRIVYGLLAACLLYPAVSGTLRILIMTPEMVQQRVAEAKTWEASNNLAYGQGTFLQAAREHTREFVHGYSTPMNIWGFLGFYVQMTTTMLLGFLIGRNGWVRRIPELLPRIRRLQWWALGVGIICALTFGILGEMHRTPGPSPIKILISFSYVTCRLGMMIFYVLTIVRLTQQPRWQQRFAPIAAAGRMPLTNYLSQTLIATTLFYGWGFGLWGKVGPALELLIAFAIFFIVQVPLSVWWLQRYEYGPLEYVWRTLTYGRRPALQSGPIIAAAAGQE